MAGGDFSLAKPRPSGPPYFSRNQIAQALGFLEEYGGIVAALILGTLGFVLYKKIFASDDLAPEDSEASSPGEAES